MDIFQIHSQIVADYKSYIRSFINMALQVVVWVNFAWNSDF
jgi:hypothetical protein